MRVFGAALLSSSREPGHRFNPLWSSASSSLKWEWHGTPSQGTANMTGDSDSVVACGVWQPWHKEKGTINSMAELTMSLPKKGVKSILNASIVDRSQKIIG